MNAGELAVYREPPSPAAALVEWADAARAAHALATSLVSTQVCPDAFRGKPDEATAVVLLGAELGMSPIAALRSMFVIRGQVGMYVRAQVALVQSRGHRVWTEVDEDDRVVVAGHRAGDPDRIERVEWTIARANRAGFIRRGRNGEPSQYDLQPRAMLYARAAGEVCRRIAADVLAGIPEGVEEPSDLGDQPRTVQRVRRGPDAAPTVGVHDGGRRAGASATPDIEDISPLERYSGNPEGLVARSDETDTRPDGIEVPPQEDTGPGITEPQRALLNVHMRALGIVDHDERVEYVRAVVERPVDSSTDLTVSEASAVIDRLTADVEAKRGERP